MDDLTRMQKVHSSRDIEERDRAVCFVEFFEGVEIW
jgi:hypothetical protein